MSYTIAEKSEGYFYKDRSKFYSFLHPIKSEDEAMQLLKQYRRKYYDATHVVYAYILGKNGEIEKYSDAGEPAGSSGPPVLRTLKANNLTNVLAIVVRYYGGKKLGIPGLIEAYSSATEDAINNGQLIEFKPISKLQVNLPINELSKFYYLSKKFDAKIKEQVFDNQEVKFVIEVDDKKSDELATSLKSLSYKAKVQKLE